MDTDLQAQVRLFDPTNVSYETCDPWDERFPEVIDRPIDADFADFCANFAEGQLQPIVLGTWSDGVEQYWSLAIGRKRLQAARQLNIPIETKVVWVNDETDIARLRYSENHFRSQNEAADVLALRTALWAGGTYNQIPGLSAKEAERLDRKWADVPVEFMEAVRDGYCTEKAALDAGKLKGPTRKKAMRALAEVQEARQEDPKARLTQKQVKELRSAVRSEAVGTMSEWLQPAVPQGQRTNWHRMEIENIQTLLYQERYDEARDYVNSLLA